MVNKKKTQFTNVVADVQPHTTVRPYKELYRDYRVDVNLTKEEYEARLKKFTELQEKNEKERIERNMKKLAEIKNQNQDELSK